MIKVAEPYPDHGNHEKKGRGKKTKERRKYSYESQLSHMKHDDELGNYGLKIESMI
jgi:hypothetical protein